MRDLVVLEKLNLRKRIFVSSRIQGQLVFRLGSYWLLYHFVLWHSMFAYHYVLYRMSSAESAISFQELYGSFVLQYYPIIVCALAMLPIFLIDLVRLTHRIAGPLVRFTNSLKAMVAGEEVRRIRLRKHDLLTELEEAYNEYVDVYERRRRERLQRDRLTDDQARKVEAIVAAPAEEEAAAV